MNLKNKQTKSVDIKLITSFVGVTRPNHQWTVIYIEDCFRETGVENK